MLILLATKEFNTKSIVVGDIKTIDIRGQDINDYWTVITPSNNEIKLIPDYTNEKLQIIYTKELGSYSIYTNGEYFSSFSTILSPSELPSKNKETIFNLSNLSVDNIRIIDSEKNFSSILKEMRYGKSIWRLLLIIALACLVIESILGIPNRDTLKNDLEWLLKNNNILNREKALLIGVLINEQNSEILNDHIDELKLLAENNL